jgi:hypothetical protein
MSFTTVTTNVSAGSVGSLTFATDMDVIMGVLGLMDKAQLAAAFDQIKAYYEVESKGSIQ